MKSVLKRIVFLLMPVILILIGCEGTHQKFDYTKYENVYMPQATEMPAEREVYIVDTLQTIDYSAAYAGVSTPGTDIPVKFSVNKALVDSFNENNFTSHPILPEASYELSKMEGTIPAGGRGTGRFDLKLKSEGYINAGAQASKYLLPVSIEIEGGAPVNQEMATTYFLIDGSYVDIDKSNWQVIDFNSQQPGRDDLAATNVIDGDKDTIWNTQYTDPRPAPPHYITIDMGQTEDVHGFEIIGRQNAWLIQNPKKITLEFSGDGQNWRDAESFTLAMNDENVVTDEIYLSSTVEARYFKLTVEQLVDPNHNPMNMAEIIAF